MCICVCVCVNAFSIKKKKSFGDFPYFLSIQLGRFTFDMVKFVPIKLSHEVSFPKVLDVEPYGGANENDENPSTESNSDTS